jgi:hypothetical protein
MRRRLVLVLSLIVCVGAVTAVALVAAAGGAGAITTLTSQRLLSSYQLASDAGGAATVLWTTEKFLGPQNQLAALIRVRQQNAQGGWRAAAQVGGVTQTNEAQLVESPSGAAAVAWYYVQGGRQSRTVLMIATRGSADGSWSAPKMIWSAGNADGLMMAVGIDAAGAATVAWAGTREPTRRSGWTAPSSLPARSPGLSRWSQRGWEEQS